MRVTTMITVWVYIILVTLLEVVASYVVPMSSWVLRDTIISVLAVSAAAVVVVFYMELRYHYRWESLILVTTLFYVADLLMIWTASLVH
jgi:flagellar biosynthesis component FlhA